MPPPAWGQDDLEVGILVSGGDAERRQREGNARARVHHGRDSKRVRGGEDQIAILGERVHAMADGVELHADKLKVLYATLNFARIVVVVLVRRQAGETEEAAGMLGTQLCDLVVALHIVPGSWVRLDDGGVDAVLVHSP